MARHNRRRGSAVKHRELVEWWCLVTGLELKVTNNDHHWRVIGFGVYVEWWPSSAKLVFDKKYRHDHHCHDHEQLIQAVEAMMRKRKVGPYYDSERHYPLNNGHHLQARLENHGPPRPPGLGHSDSINGGR